MSLFPPAFFPVYSHSRTADHDEDEDIGEALFHSKSPRVEYDWATLIWDGPMTSKVRTRGYGSLTESGNDIQDRLVLEPPHSFPIDQVPSSVTVGEPL